MATEGPPGRHLPPNRLEQLRIAQGLSRKELAEQVAMSTYAPRRGQPISERTIRRWENGETPIPVDRLPELAVIFGCSIEHLMGWDRPDGGNGEGTRAAA